MALKDSLKHFNDFDDYSGSLTKADMDNNLDLLADEIDKRVVFNPDNYSMAFGDGAVASDDNSIAMGYNAQATNDNTFAVGYNAVASSYNAIAIGNGTTASGDGAAAIGNGTTASGGGSVAMGYHTTASGYGSVAIGNYTTASNVMAVAIGNGTTANAPMAVAIGDSCEASAYLSFAFGNVINNKQQKSFGIGRGNGNAITQFVRHFNSLETTSSTQTTFDAPIALFLKSVNYLIIKCQALKDDYSTKWIFERKLIVRVDDSGNVTIDSDDNTDIVKDNSSWAFDIEAVNDSENPTLNLKVTGEDDVNIVWGIEVENRQTYWN
jgi:autotransporter adhesin